MFSDFAALVLACSGLTLMTCTLGDAVGRQLGLMDHPDGVRKLHRASTPLVGGVALIAGLFPFFAAAGGSAFQILFLAALSLFLLGALDDRHSVSPKLRFVILFGVALLLLEGEPELTATYVHIGFLNQLLPISGVPWAALAVVVAVGVVGFIVSVNMADGVNGLAPGLLLLWSALFLFNMPVGFGAVGLVLFAILLLIWIFNATGRLFMGDSGIYAGAGLLAMLVISRIAQAPASLSLDTVAVWAVVPVLDCLRLIVTRLMAGKSPLLGDRTHVHHRLLEALPAPQAVAVYLLVAGVPAALATAFPENNALWLAIACIGFVAMVKAPMLSRALWQRRTTEARLKPYMSAAE